MSLLTALNGYSYSVASFGWLIGAIAGAIFDAFLVIAIARTPRLREHGGDRKRRSLGDEILRWTPALLIVVLWLAGYLCLGNTAPFCYTAYSAAAATAVSGVVILLLMGTAANHISRRSIW